MRELSLPHALADNIQCVHNPAYDLLETKRPYGKKAAVAQLLASVIQSLMLVNVGMELAMPTLVIGSIYKNSKAEFVLSNSQSSWYGSILFICQPIGSLLSGYVQKHYGKKCCMYFACIPSIVGWIMLIYANSVTMLVLSTATMGMGLGFTDGPVYSYIGEICESRLRGVMSSLVNMACLLGMMSSYWLGFVCHWRTVAMLSLICPVLCLFLSMLIPESPIWLLSQGKNKKAMDAICWLRGWVDPSDVAFEYQQLMFYYKTSLEQMMADKSSRLTGVSSTLACLKSPSVYRPLRLATVYYLITLISCLTPCRPYIVKLMYDAGVKDTHSIALVVFGVMQLAGSLALTFTIRKFGKRMLTLGSLSVNIIALLLFSTYIACVHYRLIAARASVPMALYAIVMFSGAMGMLTIPWTLVSEIFPNEAKGLASSMITTIYYMLTFVATKIFLNLEITLGLYNTFFALSALSCFGFVYLYKNLPETEGKSLLEIEEHFVPKLQSNFNQQASAA